MRKLDDIEKLDPMDTILGSHVLPGGIQFVSKDEAHEACDLLNATKEDKIQFIYDLKANFRWMDGRTHKDLAKCWDMSVAAARGLASAADRHFRMHLGDPDAIHGKLLAQLDHVTVSAMNATKAVVVQTSGDTTEIEYVSAPDHKAAIAGIKEIAALTGLSRKKLDVNVNYEGMSMEDMMKRMRSDLEEAKSIAAPTPPALITEGKEIDD